MNSPIDLRVLETGTSARLTIAAVEATGGTPKAGMRFLTEETHDLWEVRGVSFTPIATAEAGRWGLLLAPMGHDRALRVGDHLVAA
jgi:hypothetical protein